MNTSLLNKEQKGLVSILVTMFLMLIITLIVIGFAKIIRREQRQVLDRQLSTQAFYAAESGVNDAISILKTNPTAAQSSCPNSGAYAGLNNVIDSTAGVAYTCLLVTPSPTSLIYDNIDTTKSTIIPINASGSIASLNFSWQGTNGVTSFANCPAPALGTFSFPPVSGNGAWPTANCDAGVLRLDIAPTSGTLSRAGLISGTLTAFLYPQRIGTNTLVYASDVGNNAGQVIGVTCTGGSTPRACNLGVTGLGGTSYYVRVRSIYKSNGLTITATGVSGALTLSGAQALVDSTGKANDVLRRIAVRVDTSNVLGVPDFAIQSRESICKRFTTAVGMTPMPQNADPACQLN